MSWFKKQNPEHLALAEAYDAAKELHGRLDMSFCYNEAEFTVEKMKEVLNGDEGAHAKIAAAILLAFGSMQETIWVLLRAHTVRLRRKMGMKP